ncbi:hypothetical protein HY622_00045 [Candidatus Uhrbacteria bacterium]|nr:hypothetical protein [Candidatus Uhrbacteria bacterium]
MGTNGKSRHGGEGPIRWKEAHAWKEKEDKFIDACLHAETGEERAKRGNFENAITSIQVNYVSLISHERAQRIYNVRFAIKKLYEESLAKELPSERYHILLALADELKDLEGKKGVIPALETLRHMDKESEHEILMYGPDLFFVPLTEHLGGLQEELEDCRDSLFQKRRELEKIRAGATSRSARAEAGEQEIEIAEDEIQLQKKTRQFAHDIVAALEFAQRVYDWNTSYYQNNRDIGVLSPGGDYETEREIKGPHANYLIRWRGTVFAILRTITEQRMLDYLSPAKRFDVIKNLISITKKELLNRGYYNPAIFEEPPQTEQAIRILGDLKADYMVNPEQPPRVRDRIRNELRRLVRHPDLAYPDQARDLLKAGEDELL